MKRACKHCRHWEPNYAGEGECRRYAPRPRVTDEPGDDPLAVEWPETRAGDWCGEYAAYSTDPIHEVQEPAEERAVWKP